MKKCRDCKFLSEPKVFGGTIYSSVRCTLGQWDKDGVKHWHSYGETQLNRGPVRKFGEACTRGHGPVRR